MQKHAKKAFTIITLLPVETVVTRLQRACVESPLNTFRNEPKRLTTVKFVGHVSENRFSIRPLYQFFTNYYVTATGVITPLTDGRTEISGILATVDTSKGILLALLMLGGGSMSIIGLMLLFSTQEPTYLLFLLMPLLILSMSRIMFHIAASQLLSRLCTLTDGTIQKNAH